MKYQLQVNFDAISRDLTFTFFIIYTNWLTESHNDYICTYRHYVIQYKH